MTKLLHNQTYTTAVIFMVALFVLPGSLSVNGKALRYTERKEAVSGLVDVTSNTYTLSKISEQNTAFDDTTGILCPEDISTYTDLNSCDALITSGLSIPDPENNIASLSWQMEGATNAQSSSSGINQLSSYVFNEGATVITYLGRTRYNNPINCIFTVIVSDNELPKLIYGPGNIIVSNSDDECQARVTWTEPIVRDNCVAESELQVQSTHRSGQIFPVGLTNVEYRFNDGVNELVHRFTVTVIDDVAPVVSAPEPITVVCGEDVEDAFTSWQQFEQAGGKASDNCAVDYNSFRYVSQTASDIRCPYTITRTYSIADVNGNVSEVKRYIQVSEEEPKEIQDSQEKSGIVLKSGMASYSSIKSGNWNDPSTWSGGAVPAANDDVSISTGHVVTVNTTALCNNITITGSINYSASDTLKVNGSWTNNGAFNAGTNGTVLFTGSGAATIAGSSTTAFKNFILDKGSLSDILQVNSAVVLDGDIQFKSGLLQVNSGGSVQCTGNSGFTVEALAGLYVNGGSFTGGSFSVTFKGNFQIDNGSASFGDVSGNSVLTQSSGNFEVNGGTVSVAGRLEISGGSLDVSGGTINLNTIGHSSSSTATLDMSVTSDFNMTAGTINFHNPNGSAYYDVNILNTSGTKNILGGTFNFGDGSADVYHVSTDVSLTNVNITAANNAQLEIIQNITSDGTYTFDLSDGNGNIIPVTINISASSYGSNASIEVTTTDGKFSPENASSTHFLSRYWTITLSDISGASYSVTAEYPQGDVNSGGQESEIAAGVWTGSLPWIKGNAANGGANTISINGLTSSVELTGITLDAPTVTAGANTPVCVGEALNLTASGTGDPTLSYEWTGPNSYVSSLQNPTISNATTAASGTYEVTVTDGNGFTASDNVAITVNPTPTASAPANQTYCNGDATSSISLSGTPAGVVFDISGGSSIGLADQTGVTSIPVFTADNSGSTDISATITVTPRANGCTGSPVTFNITVNPTPTVTNPGNQTLCNGENTTAVNFSGTATSFNWTNNNTSIGLGASGTGDISSFIATNSGSSPVTATITVTPVYSNNGVDCSGTPETFTITVNPIPSVFASPATQQICPGGNVTINITNPNSVAGTTFSWTRDNTGTLSGQESGNGSTISGAISSSNPGVLETTTFTITATANGCSSQTTVQVTVGDDTDPTVASCPGNISVDADPGSCTAVVNYTPPAFDDNCDGTGLSGTLTAGLASGQAFSVGITTVTYQFTDAAGNGLVECTFTVTVTDNEDPVITCPANVTVDNSTGFCYATAALVNPGTATATDNCNPNPTVSGVRSDGQALSANYPVGITTITWTASDGSNTATCDQTIEVIDNEDPTFTAPGAITIYSDASCNANRTPSQTGNPINPKDNCTATANLISSYTDGADVPGACTGSYSFTRTWTVTDEAGNTTSKNQLITVRDITPPTFISLPANTNISCEQDTSPSSLGYATATDACDNNVDISYYDIITPGNCPGNYLITRYWIATDDCGNADTLSRKITVTDLVKPVVIDNGDTTITCVTDIPNADPSVFSYYDECGSVTIQLIDEIANGLDNASGYCPFEVVRTWRLTDACNNITEFNQTITILQDENLCEACSECLEDNTFYVVDLRGDPEGEITLEDVYRQDKCCGAENVSGAQTMFCASFNVIIDDGAVGVEIEIDGTTPPGQDWKKDCIEIDGGSLVCLDAGKFHLFTYCKKGKGDPERINDYTFKSVKGLIASGDIETREECDEMLTVTGDFSNPHWTSIYPDNIGDYDNLLSSTTDTIVYFNAEPGSPSHIQYQVCGEVSATICATTTGGLICDTIDVYIRPAIEMELNINPDLICDDYIPTVSPIISPAGAYDLEWYIGATPSGTPVSYDDSYTPPATGWYSVIAIDNTTGLDCNRDTFNFEMKYDLTGPTIKDVPPPLYLQCNTSDYATQIADWLAIPTAEYVDEYGDTVSTPVSNDYYDVSGPVTMICGDTVMVEFKALDQCTNDTLAYSYIYVIDTTLPVINPQAQDSSIQCSTGNPDQDPGFLAWLANHGGARASDDCDPDLEWSVDTASTSWSGDPANNQRIVTFTVTDDCGNEDQTTATFTIIDDVPPSITCPSDVETTIAQDSCSSNGFAIDSIFAIDECSEATLEWTLTGATSGSGTGQVKGYPFNTGITVVHYTAIDGAGLTDTCSFTVWVKHLDVPTANITCPADSVWVAADEVLCEANVPLDAPLYTDPCNEIDSVWNNSPYRTSSADASGTYPIGTTEFKWFISDVSGNIDSTCTVKIVVGDVDPPQFSSCPDTIEGIIDETDCEITNFPLEEPTWTESCGADLSWIITPVTSATAPGSGIDFVPGSYSFSPGQTRITYVLTDAGGNTDTCSFIFWPKHQDFPTSNITCPDDSTWMAADPLSCDADVTLGAPIITDPCNEIDSVWNNSPYSTSTADASGSYPIGITEFKWFISDVSGNIDSSCVVKVVVADVDPPEFTNCPDTIEGIIDAADCEITNFPLEEPTWNEICGAELTYIITPVTSATAPGTGSGLVPLSYVFSPGQTRITYVLTDSGNNTDTCSFIFWPKHVDFPTSNITCPADSVWATADADCYADVQLDTVIWTDPCNEIDSIWNNSPYRTSLSDASGTYPIGATDFAWYILDVSGNMDSCNVTVIVEDDTAPYFTSCPTDTLEDIINDADCDMTNFTLENPTYEVGCGADLRWTLSGATNNSGTGLIDPSVVAFNVGITTITYILEDESNNADTCIYWAWAKRANFPTASITCPPASVSVPADPATCDAFVTLDTVVWTDPCNEIDSIWNNSPHRTSYDDASGRYPIGTTSFSWFILDVSGNMYNCDVSVTVTDTTSPNITGVTDIIECPEYVLTAGDTQLDLDTLLITDDCADSCSLGEYTMRWRIDFADGSSIPGGSGTYNTGLLSEYGNDILFPTDSTTYTTLDHTITYWVVDCSGNVSAPEIRTVSVYPPPTAIAPADTLAYCYADTVPAITLNGYPAGDVVFDVTGGSSLGISDMTGVTEIPSFWATTTGTATISITPRANGCVGSPVTFVLIITEPVTVAVSPVFQTICSGETTNIHLMSSNPGATFSYEVSSISPAGSVTGAIDSTGEYIRHTLINTTQAQATLTYTITATANGCTSPGTATATVTINPTPELIITEPDTVCEPETVDITAPEITAGSASGLTFTYWVDSAATIPLSNPSAVNQSGTYFIRASSGAGCEAFDSVHVVINPLPELTSPLNPDGICSNTAFTYTPVGNLDSILFTWTRATVSGISNPAESGTGAIDEILVNETNNPIEVTYVYTMVTPEGCSNTAEIKVIVTQSPVLTSAPPAEICSGQTFSYTPESNISGTTFSWYRDADSFGNAAASGTGNPNEVLVNNSSSTVTVVYHYSLSSNNCTNPTDFLVYVNVVPSPSVTAGANRVEICPGESVNLTSSSDAPTTSLPGTLLDDDFNTSAGNWTASGSSTWQLRDDGYSYTTGILWWTETTTFHSNDNSRFFLSNHYDTDATSYLTSDAFSTVGYNSVSLSFWHYYRRGSNEEAVVEYSTNGSNWTALESYTFSRGGASNFENITVALPVGISNLYVRFRYRTYSIWFQSSHYWWAIDNVQITGQGQSEQEVTWTSIPAGFTSDEANPTDVYPTQTTTYIAEYTDPNTNCPGYDSVTVVVRDLPDARIDADYCIIPDKIVLTASGGTSYLWNTGATTQSITIDEVDIYSVLVTDAFGCQNTAYTSVSEEQVIDGTFTNFNGAAPSFYSQYIYHADNPGSNTELVDDSGYNGYSVGTDGQDFHYDFWGFDHTRNATGDRNYMIVNGHEDIVIWEQEVTVFPNTDYYFSAWARSLNDYGPYARLQFEVNGTLVGTIANLGAGPGNASQAANSDSYWVHFYSSPLWNSGSTSGTIIIRIVNLESALGGNDFGIDDISFGTLDPLPSVVEASSNSPVCEGDSIHLSMTVTNGKEPFTYNWTGPNGFIATGQNVSIPNTDPSHSGDYIAVVTDGYGCGPVYDTVTVVVEETPTVDAGPDQELCAYERDVQLAGSIGGAADSATWSGGTGTFSDSTALNAVYTISDADTAAGVVTLVLTTNDPAGECGPVTDTMQIIIHPVVNAVLDTAIDPTCPGDADGEITVHGENGTEPYTYSWNTVPEQTTATASGLPAGTYTVTVTDAFGCWDTVSVTLTDPEVLVVDSVTFTEPLCYNGEDGTATVHISSGTNPTIVWSNGDTSLTADSLSAGLYTVTVYAENWCSSVSIPIAVTQPAPPTVDCPDDLTVYADFGADSASNVALEAPVYDNDCPLETQTWTLSGVTIDSSAQNVIDTLWVHDFNLGVTTVTYTFTDIVGNVSVCDFKVTVLAKPDIDCPPDTTYYLDGTEDDCSFTFDPGVPELITGAPPITWTYTIHFADGTTVSDTYVKPDPSDPASDEYADPLGELDFPLGVTTIEWRAENVAGFDTCSHWIEVIDTIPPTLTANPYENCVDPLHWAVYNEANPNPVYNHVDPLVEKYPVDFRTMYAGDTILDLTSLYDNCCDSADMTINWRIDFADTPDPVTGAAVSHPSISGTGQPSSYKIGGIPTDIQLWGDGVLFTPVTHTITYWVEDCNENTSEELTREITITPRPEVKKEEY